MVLFDELLKQAELKDRQVILDGAVGTELENRGARLTAPLWSGSAPIDHRELLFQIHREYVEAGAEIITACTFRTSKRVFFKAGLNGSKWREAAFSAVEIAKKAAGQKALVAGSVAPLEDCFLPKLAPTGNEAEEEHFHLCEALVKAGVDILWLETFGTLGELEAAIRAAKRAGGGKIPFAVSITTNALGELISKEPISSALASAKKHKASAFSINCIPVSHVEKSLELVTGQTMIPLGIYANLGIAEETQDWRGSAYLSPREYAKKAASWKVRIVGGCCGSTPAHIAALSCLI